VRKGLPIQELAFLGRWKSSVVLAYAEEARQEKPMGLPATPMTLARVDKSKKDAVGEDKTRISPKDGGALRSMEMAFAKPKDSRVVTKGRGWKASGDESHVEPSSQRVEHSMRSVVRIEFHRVLFPFWKSGGQAEVHELSVVPARRDVVREAHESATMKDAWKWNQQMSVGT
jgi:hypothetical protein